ncbi:MAG: MFS transporter, partial [Thiotrichales bacterium]|nr:MFS transporter [Thiotrichales bacterium]
RVFTCSCLASLIMYTATFANVVLVSLYLQYILGMAAAAAGAVMMIQPLTMAILSPVSGRLSDRIEPRLIATAGIIVTIAGLFLFASLDNQSELLLVITALLITGTGFSLFSSPNVNAIMSSVEERYYGSATATMATMRIVGQLTSMVVVTLVFNLMLANAEITGATLPQLGRAISTTFFIAALLCCSGVLFSSARGRLR